MVWRYAGLLLGDNNAKDLTVRVEEYPDPEGDGGYIPYVPGPRDLAWQDLYRKYRGQIDEQFGFLAFRTAPLVSSSTMDAKIATAGMASHLMLWAAIGKPNQRERLPSPADQDAHSGFFDDVAYPVCLQAVSGDQPESTADEPVAYTGLTWPPAGAARGLQQRERAGRQSMAQLPAHHSVAAPEHDLQCPIFSGPGPDRMVVHNGILRLSQQMA